MSILFILPSQLFNGSLLKDVLKTNSNINEIVLWEHPHFFKRRGFKFNKKKLVLHRASMKCYYDNILSPITKNSKQKISLKYVEFKNNYKMKQTDKNICIDPVTIIPKFTEFIDLLIESPNFLMSRDNLDKINNFYFTQSFYKKVKSKINLLEKTKSTDSQNRKSLDIKDVNNIPDLKDLNHDKNEYVKEAQEYVETNFKKNNGSVKSFIYPINQVQAIYWLNDFIDTKFKNFGTYQDAIVQNEPYLFHSILSSSLNIGLINPIDIIDKIRDKDPTTHYQSSIPLNSYEGFVRQLIWREYQRYCYVKIPDKLEKTNYFNCRNKLNIKWYTGQLGIAPIDDCIKKAFDSGYLHHIERLMLMGNYMLLNEIHSKHVFKWFMEFSIDSYDWVMYQNVYDMVCFNTGGVTMRKPYITSSNYVIKMSDYSKSNWSDIWDEKYKLFLKKHKEKLWKFRYHFPSLKNS